MRSSPLLALIGMTAATAQASEPLTPSLESLLSPQSNGISRDITSMFRNDGMFLQNLGFTTGGGDGVSASNQVLLALMHGEDPATPNDNAPRFPRETGPGTAIIDNFEEGFDNWTADGRSFGSRAAFDGYAYNQRSTSASTKINGFEGKHFAFSFEGRNENTGKAESKPFEVQWDQISFDIMGGTSNQTRFDLVLLENGTEKAVRTASGDGTLNFSRKSWKVKDLKGKTVKLVITDDSTASNFGFVGVDNIRGEEASTTSIAPRFMGTGPEVETLRYFLNGTTDTLWSNRCESVYGIGVDEFKALCRVITTTMISSDFDHRPAPDWTSRAHSIKQAVDKIIAKECPEANPLLKDKLLQRALYDWTRTHILYNDYLAKNRTEENRARRAIHWTPNELAKMSNPNAVCIGYANVLENMGQILNLKCRVTEGATRRQFKNSVLAAPETKPDLIGGHSWVIFEERDGYENHVDPTNSTVSLAKARELHGDIEQPITFQVTEEDKALFHAVYFPTAAPFKNEFISPEESGVKLTYQQWFSTDVSILGRSYTRATGMTWFSSALVNWPI